MPGPETKGNGSEGVPSEDLAWAQFLTELGCTNVSVARQGDTHQIVRTLPLVPRWIDITLPLTPAASLSQEKTDEDN